MNMTGNGDAEPGLHLDFSGLPPMQRYKLLSSIVVPRPIAWVTTRSATGLVNAAPYAFFNVFCEEPPLVILGLQHGDGSVPKDTARNILETKEFVVNMVREHMFDAMVASAAPLASGLSEPGVLGIETAESELVRAPRLVGAPAALECRLQQVLPLSPVRDIVLGEVVGIWTEPGLVNPANHHIDWKNDFPIGRLYADRYSRIEDTPELRRTIPTADAVLDTTDVQARLARIASEI
ncbi:MAG: flavin reductase family protein [Rhizobiaceae bacterium]